MYGNNAYKTYKQNSVNLASKDQLLLMLVDGAVKFSKIARQAILDKEIMKAHENLVKTQDIFVELMTSLDTNSGEWAGNLIALYDFINRQLINANIKKDINILEETIPLIEEVRDMWYEVNRVSKGGR